MRICSGLFLFFCFLQTHAQIDPVDPFQNYAIRLHYDSLELATIAQNDSVKFNTIRYYYTQSYLFETTACQCTPPSADHFDISEYEYLRKRNVRVERYFEKYGFKLTLFAINELQYRLPIQNP
jgi:hypothetical protein